jgi:hypothetical protein
MHSVDVRGKFGASLVFAIWRNLNYLRGLTIPANPQTSRQMAVRGFLTTCSRAWGALGDTNQTQWRDWASLHPVKDVFGVDFLLSGANWFIGLTSNVLAISHPQINTAPTANAPGQLAAWAVTSTVQGTIAVAYTAPGGTDHSEIQITARIPLGRIAQENQYRNYIYNEPATAANSITGKIPTAKYYVRGRKIGIDGQVGPWAVSSIVVFNT